MKKIPFIKDSEINWVVDYLMKQYKGGKKTPDSLLEWQKDFFPRHQYSEVYQIIRAASKKLAKATEGRIQFRHNLMQDTWRFHEGLDDYLMLLWSDGQRIGGHIKTQETDFGYGSVLTPRIKDEIMIIKPDIINIGKIKALDLKRKYTSPKK